MKIFNVTLTVLVSLIFAGHVFSQSNSVSDSSDSFSLSISEMAIERASANYYHALQSNNEGLIESAITNIMIMKLYFPERDYNQSISKLSELTTEGETKQVRYIAFIASNYLKHPERFNWIKKDAFKATSDFFHLFAEKLAKQLENTENSLLVYSK